MNQGQMTASSTGAGVPLSLRALQERGDHYAVLNIGLPHLQRDSHDPSLILLLCKSYVALGLVGPARDLLRRVPDDPSIGPEIHALREGIARAPSGRVAWSARQGRFESNVARLYARYPEMREHDTVFRGIPRQYELYRSRDGNLHLAKRSPDGGRNWIPDLCDVKSVVAGAELPHDPQGMFCGPYLVVGDRSGAMFNRVFDATQKMFLTFSPRIYLIEADAVSFGVSLYVSESVDRLCHERVVPLVGPDCLDRLVAYLGKHPKVVAPEFMVRLTAAAETLYRQAETAIASWTAGHRQRARQTADEVRRHYESLPSNHWKERFRPGRKEPLRVLGLTSRFTTYLRYSMRDWGAAFESRGHEFRVLMENNDHDLLPSASMAEAIAEFRPDLIVCIDHFRHEYTHSIPGNVPFVGWIQDALSYLYCRECGEALGPLDYYVVRQPRFMASRYHYPRSRGIGWPMVTNERVFRAAPMAERDLAPHRSDFSFVSSHSKPPERAHAERRATFRDNPAALRLVDRLFEELMQVHRENPEKACAVSQRHYEEVKEETGCVRIPPEADDLIRTAYLYPMAELIFRQRTLAWVADYCARTGRTLHLYGNGWEEHPRFREYARGFASNGPQLRAIHQASRINLQITTFGAVHQRLLDGLAAGGFFMIRRTPGDSIDGLARKFLAAVRKYDARPGIPYAYGEMPELDQAMAAFWEYHQLSPPPERYVIPEWAIPVFEDLEATEYNQVAGAVFDQYPEVAFGTPEEFERLAESYLEDADRRAAVTEAMRAVVLEKFTYAGLVDHMLSFITNDLTQSGKT